MGLGWGIKRNDNRKYTVRFSNRPSKFTTVFPSILIDQNTGKYSSKIPTSIRESDSIILWV